MKKNAAPIFFIYGIIAGILCRLTDFCPADSIWCFSSVATLFGFWIICIVIIVLKSTSNLSSGINTFLYMFGMTLSFYVLKYILGLLSPAFVNDGFQTNLFILYSVLSLGCGIGAYILYWWNKEIKGNAVLYALPIGALLAETIGVLIYFMNNKVFLFQLLMDIIASVTLGAVFYKRAKSKVIYTAAIFVITFTVYMIVYRPFLT